MQLVTRLVRSQDLIQFGKDIKSQVRSAVHPHLEASGS